MKYNKIKIFKYLIVFMLFLLVYIFGKNLNELSDKITLLNLNDKENILPAIAFLDYQSSIYIDKNPFIKGDGRYRLVIRTRYVPDPTSISKEDIHPKTSDMEIYLASKNGERKKINTLRLNEDKIFEWNEVLIDATGDQDILLAKSPDKDGTIYIDEMTATKIDSINNLKPTIFGQINLFRIWNTNIDPSTHKPWFKFSRRNQSVGIIYKANSDNIASVKMKIKQIGNGGNENYLLKIQEASLVNGKYVLNPKILSSFYFKARDLKKYIQPSEEDVFNFPLPSFTEKGKYYFISLDNSAVNFNTINTLRIFGNNTKQSNFVTASQIGNGKLKEESHSIYLDLLSAKTEEANENKILYNSVISDLGNGVGKYSYENLGLFEDYLNLNEIVANNNTQDKVFYDQIQKGISGTASSDTAFIYKFDSIYPFTKIVIEAESVSGEFNRVKMWYSFNKTDWQEILPVFDKEETFSKSIDASLQKTIYLKVSYDEKSNTKQRLFGLTNLKVFGDLVLK